MEIEISLDRDLREIENLFDDLKHKAVTTAARQALNRAVTGMRTFATKEIREERKLLARDIRNRISILRAKGSELANLEAAIFFRGVPLPLILFIVGRKEPRISKRANRFRRPLSVEIRKGQKKKKPGIYIATAKRGPMRYQVFRRTDKKDRSQGMKMQAAPSIAEMLRAKTNIRAKIEAEAMRRLQNEFSRALQFNLSKLTVA